MREDLYANIVTDENLKEAFNTPLNRLEDAIKIKLISNCEGVDLGQTFTYTIVIENSSEINFYNINITQQLHRNLRLCEVMLDSINVKNVDRYNKYLTMFISELKAKERKSIEIIVEVVDTLNVESFKSVVKLETLNPNNTEMKLSMDTPICVVNVIAPKINLIKKASVIEAAVGDRITFTLLSENNGNIPINNLIIRDILKPELRFLNNTVKLDGIPIGEESVLSGVNIGELNVGESKILSFEVEVLDLPEEFEVTNISIANYQYEIPGDERLREGNAKSNKNILKVQKPSVDIYKTISNDEISLGDELTINIKVTNNGTVETKNVEITEIIPDNFKLIDGTFKIDNQVLNSITFTRGILIGDLKIGESRRVSYTLKYLKGNNNSTLNLATKANFHYKLSSGLIFKGREIVKEIEVNTTISNFKYVNFNEVVYKSLDNPPIYDIDKVNAEVEIIEYHVIKTAKGVAYSGQILTGFKVMVQGYLNEIIEYTSNLDDKSVYSMNCKIPFSTYIVLPPSFKEGSKIDIDYIIEDTGFKNRDINSAYTTVNFLLIAKVQSYMKH
ncbi:MAG: SPOCS domain-containing protein [Clostridium sp.]